MKKINFKIILLVIISINVFAQKLDSSSYDLNILVTGLTENLYLYENNQDYLIINGAKIKISFNRFKKWRAGESNILQSKKALKSLDNLKKIIKNKSIKLMIYGYYDEYGNHEYQISSWSFKFIYDLFNYFDLKTIKLNKYNLSYGFKIKGSNYIFNDYLYEFVECTGDNQFIYTDNMRYTIYFDKENSDKNMLKTFYALKWEILYVTNKKIRVIGYYDKASRMFILKHWYLKPPFKEIIHDKDDHYIKTIKRWRFKKSDFRKKTYWGKTQIRNPKIYNSSRYFYRNYKFTRIKKLAKIKKDNLFIIYIKKLFPLFLIDKKYNLQK